MITNSMKGKFYVHNNNLPFLPTVSAYRNIQVLHVPLFMLMLDLVAVPSITSILIQFNTEFK